MNRMTVRRLRAPVFTLVFGAIISTSVGIGQSWIGAALAYAVTAIVSVMFFLYGWSESDTGAVISGKLDERQELVRLKAANAGLVTAIAAAGIACLVSAIVKATFWPYEVIVDVIALAYLVALRAYGVAPPSTEGEGGPG